MKINFLYLLLLISLFACQKKSSVDVQSEIELTCDFELLTKDQSKIKTTTKSVFMEELALRSDSISHSGAYSIRSSKDHAFVSKVELSDVQLDQHFYVSIWRYGGDEKGMLVVQGDKFWISEKKPVQIDDNGWQLLELDFYIPPNSQSDRLKIYFWNSGAKPVYVDDLKVTTISNKKPIYEQRALRLFVQEKELNKLNDKRKAAFANKMLIADDDSYVKSILFFGDEEMKAKIRLKGDWLDHISGVKWSFRVKLKKQKAWKGMRTFNIQTPEARSFLKEWLAHKMAEKLDILTTRYEFVPVYLNNKSLGLYVYEEHFEKQLIEKKNRREGPLLKLSENQLWSSRKFEVSSKYPTYEAAQIIPFKRSKTIKSEKLFSQFNVAKDKLNAFKNAQGAVDDIFDVDKTAKFLAFVDFLGAYHGVIWHNLRFYYNPVLSKLEPVAYDLYADHEIEPTLDKRILGNFNENNIHATLNGDYSFSRLFSDSVFTTKYIEYLTLFADSSFLDEVMDENKQELETLESMIKREFSDYSYDVEYLPRMQERIRHQLSSMVEKSNRNYASVLKNKKPIRHRYETTEPIPDLMPLFLQVYKDNDSLVIVNYNPHPVYISGYGIKKEEPTMLDRLLVIERYTDRPTSVILPVGSNKINRVFVKPTIDGKSQEINVIPWESPTKSSPSFEKNIRPSWVVGRGKELFVPKGHYVMKNDLFVPKGYVLSLEAGVEIDLINGACIWSYGKINFMGEEASPVVIKSSDQSANGINIIQAQGRSEIKYTVFENINTFNRQSWTLTGAVNFYESDVDVVSCTFRNNHCEDALNIVRSDFLVDHCDFNEIFSDAFDSDFCVGILSNTIFDHIGNDAIDFSGSEVQINSITVLSANDKGVSGGEDSKLSLSNSTISNCKIGIASKDDSEVELTKITIDHCKYGLVLYQKKPEYGPGTIRGKTVKFISVSEEYLIEKMSKLYMDGRLIIAKEKKLAKRFY